jgi:hypothetical protein
VLPLRTWSPGVRGTPGSLRICNSPEINSMKDLSVFSDSGFDPKAWINAACAGRQQDEPLERFLAELEMRLQVRPSQQSQVCSTHQPDVIDGCIWVNP